MKLNMTTKRLISSHDSVGGDMLLYPIVVCQQFGPDIRPEQHRLRRVLSPAVLQRWKTHGINAL